MIDRLDKTISVRSEVSRRKKIIVLLTEYLFNKNYQVNHINTVSGQKWVSGYIPKSRFAIDYQIIDKKGINKGSFTYLQQADIVVIPFIPHSANWQLIIPWFSSLSQIQQKKVYFLPKQPRQLRLISKKNNNLGKKRGQITLALNVDLVQQAEGVLQSQWKQDDYTYTSLSSLIRASLCAYQRGQLVLAKPQSDKKVPKKEFNMRMDEDLLNFYYSLPAGQRVKFVERSLLAYLVNI